jgi:iron complex outermembrane receptor protein
MKGLLLTGAAMVALLPVGKAHAQDAPPAAATPEATADAQPADGNDILVTARRTSERLQDVPIAVTALSGDALTERNVASLDEVAKFTPNIRFDGAAALSGGNYNATVFVRGVGQNDFAIFSDPGVGFYVDDVYYARSIGGVLDAVDIQPRSGSITRYTAAYSRMSPIRRSSPSPATACSMRG